MATELAKAYVQIIPSAQGIGGSISSVLNKEASTAGDSAGKVVGNGFVSKIKMIIAAAGIGAALKASLSEGANLQQSLGGIETLFKENSNKVILNAKNAYKTAGMSANAYMESVTSFSASLLQGLAGDTNKAADVADMALTDMSDNANKMGTAMELIQNAYQGFAKQNYTMLDNLKLGYGGTKTEMERLLIDAEKLTGVKYDITNLSDVYTAIHAIQQDLDITGTTAKEAATTFSGSLASMKAAASNVLANLTLGQDVTPSLIALKDTIGTFIIGNLIPMVGNLLSSLPEVLAHGFSFAVSSLNKLASNADNIITAGTSLVKNLILNIVSNIPQLAKSATDVILAFTNAILDMDWAQFAGKLISQLEEGLDSATYQAFGTNGNFIDILLSSIKTQLPAMAEKGVSMVSSLVQGISSAAPKLITIASDIISKFVTFFVETAPILGELGVDLILAIDEGFANNFEQIKNSAVELIDSLLAIIVEHAPNFIEKGSFLLEKLTDGLLENAPQLISILAGLILNLIELVIQYSPKFTEIGFELIGELTVGISSAAPKLMAKIPEIIVGIFRQFKNVDWGQIGKGILEGIAVGLIKGIDVTIDATVQVGKRILNSFKDMFDINSPSRVFKNEVGKMLDLGLAAGIRENVDVVTASMKELSKATIGATDTDLIFTTPNLIHESARNPVNEVANYDSIRDIIRSELKSIVIQINDREFGRAVRRVYST